MTHQYIQFYVKGTAVGDAFAYSTQQTFVIGCPSEAFSGSETAQTFTDTIVPQTGEITIFTFVNPTCSVSACTLVSNAIIDELEDGTSVSGRVTFASGCT